MRECRGWQITDEEDGEKDGTRKENIQNQQNQEAVRGETQARLTWIGGERGVENRAPDILS